MFRNMAMKNSITKPIRAVVTAWFHRRLMANHTNVAGKQRVQRTSHGLVSMSHIRSLNGSSGGSRKLNTPAAKMTRRTAEIASATAHFSVKKRFMLLDLAGETMLAIQPRLYPSCYLTSQENKR